MSLPSGQAPASGSALTDLDLISRIKVENDSAAVTELVHRHTGAYYSVIQQYENYSNFRLNANVPDLKDDKLLNIYRWATSYNPTRGMQFGTYVMEMTKFMCKSLSERGHEKIDIEDTDEPVSDDNVTDTAERDSALETVRAEVRDTDDPLFRKIFKLRHGQTTLTWRAVGERVGLTHEGARKHYMKHMNAIKERARA